MDNFLPPNNFIIPINSIDTIYLTVFIGFVNHFLYLFSYFSKKYDPTSYFYSLVALKISNKREYLLLFIVLLIMVGDYKIWRKQIYLVNYSGQ